MVLKINSALLLAASLFFISCKEELKVQDDHASGPIPVTENANPESVQQPIITQPASVAAKTTTLPRINPPHGEPGHRCEIPVGAPLNSQPTSQLGTVQQSVTVQQPTLAPTVTTTTAPGMNPPHGEPGHRCDIKVGDPLPK